MRPILIYLLFSFIVEERKRKKNVVTRERGGRRTNITLARTIITINSTNTSIN
jgi:hypothetical protein